MPLVEVEHLFEILLFVVSRTEGDLGIHRLGNVAFAGSGDRIVRKEIAPGRGIQQLDGADDQIRRVVLHIHAGHDTPEGHLALHAGRDGHDVVRIASCDARHGDARAFGSEFVSRMPLFEDDAGQFVFQLVLRLSRRRFVKGVIGHEDETLAGFQVAHRGLQCEIVGSGAVRDDADGLIARRIRGIAAQESPPAGVIDRIDIKRKAMDRPLSLVVRSARSAVGDGFPRRGVHREAHGNGASVVSTSAGRGLRGARHGRPGRYHSDKSLQTDSFHCFRHKKIIKKLLYQSLSYSSAPVS